ncbi:hypothetical protein [Roseomonas marmotae]|uniref:Uncharacterized protein n=1 Tax=Roseomonas marmotae TaxID=2768161 RepID=A0ABS3KDS8_9PROT|nr:hypothetical protein [Roseomonas marmotae]MBO1075585.1 hypothetical protein [Roseomonas marmotae]QTI79447.1 hypothetical protein IAI58_01075 [Roseomonas marmotae]
MIRTVTGLFDTRGAAESVIHHLISHDEVDRSRVVLHGRAKADDGFEHQGIWISLLHLFVPDQDRHAYSEAIRRGGYVVSVELPEDKIPHVMLVFETHGAIDFDARQAQWRAEGWRGYQPPTQAPVAGIGVATGMGIGNVAGGPSTGAAPGGMAANPEAAARGGRRDESIGDGRIRSYIKDSTPR